jgi:hypothetical protein
MYAVLKSSIESLMKKYNWSPVVGEGVGVDVGAGIDVGVSTKLLTLT